MAECDTPLAALTEAAPAQLSPTDEGHTKDVLHKKPPQQQLVQTQVPSSQHQRRELLPEAIRKKATHTTAGPSPWLVKNRPQNNLLVWAQV